MNRARNLFAILAVVALAGCANFAAGASLTIVTAEEAGKLAATIGADAYKAENEAVAAALLELAVDATLRRAELGCGTTEPPESLPAGCDRAAWLAHRDAAVPKFDALMGRGDRNDRRFDVLEKALETHAHALELTARAILVYVRAKERGSSPAIADLIVQVLAAYGTVAEALAVWGVAAPAVPGL